MRSLRLLARLRSQVLKRWTFHFSRQTGKDLVPNMIQASVHSPKEKVEGLGRFGPSQPHPWTPRQSSPPDLKDRKNMRLKRSALWIVANESQRCRGAIQEERVYLKHDNG